MFQRPNNLITVAHKSIEYCEQILRNVRTPRNFSDIKNVIDILDTVSNNLCSIIDYSQAVLRLSRDLGEQKSVVRASQMALDYMGDLNADRTLYNAIITCLSEDVKQSFLEDEERRVGISFKDHFEKSGMSLSASQLTLFRKLQDKITRIGSRLDSGKHDGIESVFNLACYRNELSSLLGYNSYASLTLQDHYLSTIERVEGFLDDVCRHSRITYSSHFDPTFASQKGLNEHIADIQKLCWDLFNIRIEVCERRTVFGHHAEILLFTVNSEPYGHVVILSASPTNHMVSPCHFNIRTWRAKPALNVVYHQDAEQKPICLIALPIGNRRHMDYREVESLYHEFGHALQTIVGKTQYHHLSGTRCRHDYAEVPSSLMELILKNYPVHQEETRLHRPISTDYATFDYKDIDRQILLSKFDLHIHSCAAAQWQDPDAFIVDLKEWTSRNSHICRDGFGIITKMRNYSHLYHYGVGYYTYLLGRRVAEEAYIKYFDRQSSTYNPNTFVKLGLAVGGTKSTKEIISGLELPLQRLYLGSDYAC